MNQSANHNNMANRDDRDGQDQSDNRDDTDDRDQSDDRGKSHRRDDQDIRDQSDDRLSRKRLIVIVPHEPGQLAHVTNLLAEENINLESIDGRLVGELGVITLSTSDDDAALHVLLKANLRAVTSDAIVLHMFDRPGALAGVLQSFERHSINVRTIHILHRHASSAVVAVTTDNDDQARTLLDNNSLL